MIAGGGALAVRNSEPLLALRADQSTAVGERRHLTLDDGSTLSLNTDSALDIRFDARQRLLHLRQGEMLVDAVDEARPLRVETPQGLVLLNGGRLAVRLQDSRSQVSLFAGDAQVFSHGQRLALHPGQRLDLDARGSGAAQAVDENSVAWINGMLVASSMRLGDFLAELGRYVTDASAATRPSPTCASPAPTRWTTPTASSPCCRAPCRWRCAASPATGSACTPGPPPEPRIGPVKNLHRPEPFPGLA